MKTPLLLIVLLLIAAPALAGDRDRDRDHDRHHDRHHDRDWCYHFEKGYRGCPPDDTERERPTKWDYGYQGRDRDDRGRSWDDDD